MAGQRSSILEPSGSNGPIVDTHAHLTGSGSERADEMVETARRSGLVRVLAVGSTVTSSEEAVRLADRHADVFAATGIHPNEVTNHDDLAAIERLAGESRTRAIGETGLDYYRDSTDRGLQRASLLAHLELAAKRRLPIVIHNRQADEDLLTLLDQFRGRVTGIMHCFSGGLDLARRVLDLGYHLSFAGNLTYPSATEIRDVAAWAPLDMILVETDTPYLSPVPLRGKPNQPANVVHTLRVLAGCRGIEQGVLASAIAVNAATLLRW
jgi:TatD DNase family protein